MRSDFEQQLIASLNVRLQRLQAERHAIHAALHVLNPKRRRKSTSPSGSTTSRLVELDEHRRTRLRATTRQSLNRDEARAVKRGERGVAAQT